jgi:hypothetical protein
VLKRVKKAVKRVAHAPTKIVKALTPTAENRPPEASSGETKS